MALPLIVAGLVGGLVTAASSFVGRALIALGVGYVTFSGISVLLDGVKALAIQHISGAGDLVPILALLKVDVMTSILFSALAARLLLKGLTNGSITRMIIK